jgi:multidrug efflux system outer membrane protein
MNRSVIGLTLAAMLSGCSLAPDYVHPAPPVTAQWPDGARAEGAHRASELDLASFYPDPRLQALIGVAQDNNRDLRISTARVAEAQALYGIQRADRLPTVSLGADRSVDARGPFTDRTTAV